MAVNNEAGNLLGFVASVTGEQNLRVEENLGDGFVRLRVAEAERRQAKHDIRCIEDVVIEMLRNARDARARKIFVATTRDANTRTLVMIDDGDGIPAHMQDRIFDARVTSKLETIHTDRWGVYGRGMALFSVRENVSSAKVVTSTPGLGTSLCVVSDATKLSERADQSTWPTVGTDDDGQTSVVRGPHNIVRTCCEFAVEERGVCEVYLGSPSEIAATLRDRCRLDDESRHLFVDDIAELPVCERLYAASDASDFMEIAASLGLVISERTAHRILSGQIKPLRSVLARLMHRSDPSTPAEVDLMKDRRGLKVSSDDLGEFSRMMERDFSYLADRYYLSLSAAPHVRVTKNRILVSFDLDKPD